MRKYKAEVNTLNWIFGNFESKSKELTVLIAILNNLQHLAGSDKGPNKEKGSCGHGENGNCKNKRCLETTGDF